MTNTIDNALRIILTTNMRELTTFEKTQYNGTLLIGENDNNTILFDGQHISIIDCDDNEFIMNINSIDADVLFSRV